MTFDLFISFDGECREAVAFYAKVFKSEVVGLMTYGEMPPDPNYPVPESDKEKVMYSCVPIFGSNIMFSDVTAGMPLIKGNNLSPTLGTNDKEEIKRIFDALSEGGNIEMPLQQTFWSELYGLVVDKFGIIWQLSHASENCN